MLFTDLLQGSMLEGTLYCEGSIEAYFGRQASVCNISYKKILLQVSVFQIIFHIYRSFTTTLILTVFVMKNVKKSFWMYMIF